MTDRTIAAPAAAPPKTSSWYVVGICMLAYLVAFIDRQILALLIEPVRADLQLTDTQFGLLNGLAFSLFYAMLGVPIATLSDRTSRARIIAVGVAFWSVATIACGYTRSFAQLFTARVCVGAGEAALTPATYSLLADLFPKEQLGRAVAVYSIGSFLGAGVAFLVGGSVIAMIEAAATPGWGIPFLAGLKAWQIAFVLVGAPGIVLALVIHLTVHDPMRGTTMAADTPGFGDVLRFLAANRRIFICHFAGYTCAALALYGMLSWSPAYLIRSFGYSMKETGFWLGLIVMVGCASGVMASGALMDLLMRRGRSDAPFLTGMIGAAGVVIPVLLLPFIDSPQIALPVLFVGMFFVSFPMPPSTAAMQLVAPARMRSRVSATFLLCNSLFGLALGSFLIGASNDHLFSGPKAVASSLALVVGGASILAVLLLGAGLRPLREKLESKT